MSDPAPALPPSHRLVHLAETQSTNAEAMRLALGGEMGPLWVWAERQTGGRGRSGRTWVSEPGNLFASLLISAACAPARIGQLSLVAGVAVIDAIRKSAAPGVAAAPLRLKWPNDILIGSAKTGGILVESTTRPGAPDILAVVGVGLNLKTAPAGLGRDATNLAAHGMMLSPERALCFLAEAMDTWLGTWNEGEGFAQIRDAWLERAGPLGEPLAVHAGAGVVSGRFAGLDPDGALLIATEDGARQRFTYGDVTLASGDANEETTKDGKGE